MKLFRKVLTFTTTNSQFNKSATSLRHQKISQVNKAVNFIELAKLKSDIVVRTHLNLQYASG